MTRHSTPPLSRATCSLGHCNRASHPCCEGRAQGSLPKSGFRVAPTFAGFSFWPHSQKHKSLTPNTALLHAPSHAKLQRTHVITRWPKHTLPRLPCHSGTRSHPNTLPNPSSPQGLLQACPPSYCCSEGSLSTTALQLRHPGRGRPADCGCSGPRGGPSLTPYCPRSSAQG